MTVTASVPSVFSTMAAAFASFPAVPIEDHIMEIDADSKQEYPEALSSIGSSWTAANNLIVRKLPTSVKRPVMAPAAGRPILAFDPFQSFFDMAFYNNDGQAFAIQGNDVSVNRSHFESNHATFIHTFEIAAFTDRAKIINCSIEGLPAALGTLNLGGNNDNCEILNSFIKARREGAGGNRSVINVGSGGSDLIIRNCALAAYFSDQIIRFEDASPIDLILNGNKYLSTALTGRLVNFADTTFHTTVASLQGAGFELGSPAAGSYDFLGIPVSGDVKELGVTDASITDDYFGNTRSSVLDIGPFSFFRELALSAPALRGLSPVLIEAKERIIIQVPDTLNIQVQD